MNSKYKVEKNKFKGISLISVIIMILIIAILAAIMIPSGVDKINNAKLTTFNDNIMILKQDANVYFMQNDEYPIKTDGSGNPVIYSISENPTLVGEATKKNDQNDIFYIIDLDKLKMDNKDSGIGKTIDDYYIIAKTSGSVYYAKGTKIGNMTYYTKQNKGDGVVAVVPTSAPSGEYRNPIIPTGFTYIGSETWDNGFTIQDSNGNQFVWVPVSNLTANGTLDGITFNSKFGRRNFNVANGDIFDANHFYETNDTALQNMAISVNKYGGFYIAKYEASNNGGGKAQSKADAAPWTNIDWNTSKTKAESMDTDWGWNTAIVESYLCYSAHWDTTLQWLIDSNNKTLEQIKDDSSSWANYKTAAFTYGISSTTKSFGSSTKINTGVSTNPVNRHMTKGIYDLAGNVWEWTMENYTNVSYVHRGGGYDSSSGDKAKSSYRDYDASTSNASDIGFRVVLYIR